jgi:predicted Zn-dependent protease
MAALVLVPGLGLAVEKITFTPGWNLFSPRQDAELGKRTAAQIEKQIPTLNDADTLEYLNRLGKRLVGFAPNNQSEYVWQFRIVNSADINAFALPGGYIFVNRGAIDAAENEAELAGVMAHESGHVVMRHGTHMVTERMPLELGAGVLGGLLGQNDSFLSQIAQLGIGLGLNSVLLKYSRSAEAQADEVGTYILYQAGYDPHAMAQFFQIIEKKYPQRTLQFFSDHPNPDNRERAIEQEAQRLPQRTYGYQTGDFQRMKQVVATIKEPPPPAPAKQ